MPNDLFTQYGGQNNSNPMLQRLKLFQNTFTGDPKQMVQNLLNSGKINQTQLNSYIQQANELYRTFGRFMK